MKFIKRYIVDWFTTSALWLLGAFVMAWLFDGWAVYTSFILLACWVIGYVPTRVYLDYKRVCDYLGTVRNYSRGECSGTELRDKTVTLVCEETGFPEDLVSWILTRYDQRTLSQQSTGASDA